MTMPGVRAPACDTCAHINVCKLREEFIKAQQAVDNTMVGLGGGNIKRLQDFTYIPHVNLRCQHYIQKEKKEVIFR